MLVLMLMLGVVMATATCLVRLAVLSLIGASGVSHHLGMRLYLRLRLRLRR
jgi:hypothetical protein